MHVLFTRPLTADSRAVGEPYERGRPEIDAAHGRVFVGTSDHGLYALRASNGSTIWRFETLGAVQSEPLYDPELDVVYFGSNDGALYAVHASDGTLVWRFETGAEVARKPGPARASRSTSRTPPTTSSRSIGARARAHGTCTGRPRSAWRSAATRGRRTIAESVYIAFSDGHVGAYDARDGSEKWPPVDLSAEAEQTQGGEAPRYLDVDTTPVPDDLGPQGRVVYVASYAGGVFALDEERGAPVWKNDKAIGVTDLRSGASPRTSRARAARTTPPDGPPVPSREILLASSGASGLWAPRSVDRSDLVAHPDSRGRRDGAGADRGRAARRHHALRRVLAVAARRPAHRRLRSRLRILADARHLR